MKYKVKVWDLPIRVFHWLLAISIPFMWFSAHQGGDLMLWHLRIGLFIGALILFRVVWGFIGSDTARFSQFIKGPKQIQAYLHNQISENEQPGHNPLGALMVVFMLLVIFFQVITGLFSADENAYIYDGYLSGLISSHLSSTLRFIHINFFWLIVGLITLHISAVLFYRLIKKINLIIPMITGYKYLEKPLPVLNFKSSIISLIIVIICLLLMFLLSLI